MRIIKANKYNVKYLCSFLHLPNKLQFICNYFINKYLEYFYTLEYPLENKKIIEPYHLLSISN